MYFYLCVYIYSIYKYKSAVDILSRHAAQAESAPSQPRWRSVESGQREPELAASVVARVGGAPQGAPTPTALLW